METTMDSSPAPVTNQFDILNVHIEWNNFEFIVFSEYLI